VAAALFLGPAAGWPSMIALMTMHVVAWAVTVSMLTRLTVVEGRRRVPQFLDTPSSLLVEIATGHECSPLPPSLRLPTGVSVSVYRADGHQVSSSAAFVPSLNLPCRVVGTFHQP
jgi:hypothetical protein